MHVETPAPQHMFGKLDLYHKLIRRRYHPNISLLVDVIVSTLSPTWLISVLHEELKRSFLDLVNLSKRLESKESEIHPILR